MVIASRNNRSEFSASEGTEKNSHPILPMPPPQNCANLATAPTPAHDDTVVCVFFRENNIRVSLNFVIEKAFLNDNLAVVQCRYVFDVGKRTSLCSSIIL